MRFDIFIKQFGLCIGMLLSTYEAIAMASQNNQSMHIDNFLQLARAVVTRNQSTVAASAAQSFASYAQLQQFFSTNQVTMGNVVYKTPATTLESVSCSFFGTYAYTFIENPWTHNAQVQPQVGTSADVSALMDEISAEDLVSGVTFVIVALDSQGRYISSLSMATMDQVASLLVMAYDTQTGDLLGAPINVDPGNVYQIAASQGSSAPVTGLTFMVNGILVAQPAVYPTSLTVSFDASTAGSSASTTVVKPAQTTPQTSATPGTVAPVVTLSALQAQFGVSEQPFVVQISQQAIDNAAQQLTNTDQISVPVTLAFGGYRLALAIPATYEQFPAEFTMALVAQNAQASSFLTSPSLSEVTQIVAYYYDNNGNPLAVVAANGSSVPLTSVIASPFNINRALAAQGAPVGQSSIRLRVANPFAFSGATVRNVTLGYPMMIQIQPVTASSVAASAGSSTVQPSSTVVTQPTAAKPQSSSPSQVSSPTTVTKSSTASGTKVTQGSVPAKVSTIMYQQAYGTNRLPGLLKALGAGSPTPVQISLSSLSTYFSQQQTMGNMSSTLSLSLAWGGAQGYMFTWMATVIPIEQWQQGVTMVVTALDAQGNIFMQDPGLRSITSIAVSYYAANGAPLLTNAQIIYPYQITAALASQTTVQPVDGQVGIGGLPGQAGMITASYPAVFAVSATL